MPCLTCTYPSGNPAGSENFNCITLHNNKKKKEKTFILTITTYLQIKLNQTILTARCPQIMSNTDHCHSHNFLIWWIFWFKWILLLSQQGKPCNALLNNNRSNKFRRLQFSFIDRFPLSKMHKILLNYDKKMGFHLLSFSSICMVSTATFTISVANLWFHSTV